MFIDEINEKILESYEFLTEKEQDLQTLNNLLAPSVDIFKCYCELQYLKLKIKLLKGYLLLDNI